MQNQTSELLETIGNYEIGQLEGMKDSLSDFFSEWVNSLEEKEEINKRMKMKIETKVPKFFTV